MTNAAQVYDRLLKKRWDVLIASDEFLGAADYIAESVHDLLPGNSTEWDLLSGGMADCSDTGSTVGSHHPSRECFVADEVDGLLGDDSNDTPPATAGQSQLPPVPPPQLPRGDAPLQLPTANAAAVAVPSEPPATSQAARIDAQRRAHSPPSQVASQHARDRQQ